MSDKRDKTLAGKQPGNGTLRERTRDTRAAQRPMTPRHIIGLLLIALSAPLFGCSGLDDEHLERTYGKRGGVYGRNSVNGTAVLSEMFRQAGHRVITKRELTPSVHEADVLVWFPNDFQPPSDEVTIWLEQWLDVHDGGIVIYVGRDFDAAIPYWEAVIPGATGPVATEMASRRDEDLDDFGSERTIYGGSAEFRWYNYDATVPRRKVTTLSGPWSEGIDAGAVEMELYGKIASGQFEYDDREVLLASGEDPLITRIGFPHDEETYDEFEEAVGETYDYDDYETWYLDKSEWEPSELILVSNGSFLLNEPLVNHENRKLAGRLIDRCAGKETVVFLESGPGGISIKDRDPPREVPSSLMIFAVWPLNIILVHLAIVGVVFCFARWPIFGRPRHQKLASISDFGHHVSALGSLLSRTENRSYARHQIATYRQSYKGEAAAAEPETGPSSPPATDTHNL